MADGSARSQIDVLLTNFTFYPKIRDENHDSGVLVTEHIVDAQIRVIADEKESLLLELGKIIISSGFRLLKHYMAIGSKSVSVTLTIRGPEANLLELADGFTSNARVRSYESNIIEAPAAPVAAPQAAVARPMRIGLAAAGAAKPADVAALTAAIPEEQKPVAAAKPKFDAESVERLLPQLAADYPHILPRLALLQRELPEEQQESVLEQVGARVGTWVYRRDFSRGAKLNVAQAIKQIALPAVRRLATAEFDGEHIRIRTSPFCGDGQQGKTCHFFRGFFQGVVGNATIRGEVKVEEVLCANIGSDHCRFAITD